MAFTIPNEADAAFPDQSEPDKVDIDILINGLRGNGIRRGCQVTAQGSPDMTVHVAAGSVSVGGVLAEVAADDLAVTAADSTDPRFDLVAADDTGALAMVDGTPDPNPVFPPIPADSVILAAVYVPANDTDIDADQITDKRIPAGWSVDTNGNLHGFGSVDIDLPESDLTQGAGRIEIRDHLGNALINMSENPSIEFILGTGAGTTVQITFHSNAIIQGDTSDNLRIESADLVFNTNTVGFFDATPISQPSITGALSSVTDSNARDVLTSLIAAFGDAAGYNLIFDGTT